MLLFPHIPPLLCGSHKMQVYILIYMPMMLEKHRTEMKFLLEPSAQGNNVYKRSYFTLPKHQKDEMTNIL